MLSMPENVKVVGAACSFAKTNHDGAPHVTPIGSLILTDPGEACFFEVRTRQLSRNLDFGGPIAALGVISSSRRSIA